MLNLIVSAEPYGFGPVSKATELARVLRTVDAYHVDFAGQEPALTFAEGAAGVFDSCIFANHAILADVVTRKRYSLAVSVMEPFLALLAVRHKLPCIYIDSLYWLWEFPESHEEIDTLEVAARRMVEAVEDAKAVAMLSELHPHLQQFVGHFLAGERIVQRFGSVSGLARERLGGPVEVGGMCPVLTGGSEQNSLQDPRVLVSLSGLRNPLVTDKLALLWAESALWLVEEACEKLDAELVLCGNPSLIGQLRPGKFRVLSLSDHSTVLNEIRSAACFLAPPGITSLVEAWGLHVPFIALPRMHYAHETILARALGIVSELAHNPASGDDAAEWLPAEMRSVAGRRALVEAFKGTIRDAIMQPERNCEHWDIHLTQAMGDRDGLKSAVDAIRIFQCKNGLL